jgi:chromosome segregation ATPase
MKDYCEQSILNSDKISHIQKEIDKHNTRLGELEKQQVKTDTILEQSVATNKELSSVMKQISSTMIAVQHSLANNNNEIKQINQKLTDLNHKVNTEVEKSKIDMRDLGKSGLNSVFSNFLKGLIIASASYGAISIGKELLTK